jgi:aspartyl-tRNA(Asn)/glutamyl-tRNA(Gln) amidotransferase subunit A
VAELADLGVAELLAAYRSREATPGEALLSCLGRIERLDPAVGAILTLVPERAAAAAAESTRRWMRGEPRTLEGVPYGLKDIIASDGVRTTGGSRLFADYIPSESATAHARLEQAGAVLVAKLQTYEFAIGANSHTRNPWALDRTPGGSSSGSAAAVAARELPLSLGTDTSGSITMPAALTGITGLKPTYGRIPRTGVMPLSWTLDHVGCLTRSARDAAVTLAVVAGFDEGDATAAPTPVDDYLAASSGGLQGVRIGRPSDWFFDICDPAVIDAVDGACRVLSDAGATIVDVPLPTTRGLDVEAIVFTIMAAEAGALHREHRHRLEECGPEFRRFLNRSQFVYAGDYLQALRLRHCVQLDFEKTFERAAVLIVPGCVTLAPLLSDLKARIGDEYVPWVDVVARSASICSLVGLPTCTVPAGLDASLRLPLSISVVGRPFAESACLRVARTYQAMTSHHLACPPIVSADAAEPHPPFEIRADEQVIEQPLPTTSIGPPTW